MLQARDVVGISNSWFAVRGCARDAALTQLGLEADFEIGDDWPPGGRFAVGDLPGGWLLFIAPDLEDAFSDRFVALSAGGEAVACAIEEHVMYQEARGYRDGAEVWRVVHDPDKAASLFHLDVTGAPPANFEAMRAKALAKQKAEGGEDAGVDLISDVPLDLAKSICGFKHDSQWPKGLSFTILRRARPVRPEGGARSGFFARLFGLASRRDPSTMRVTGGDIPLLLTLCSCGVRVGAEPRTRAGAATRRASLPRGGAGRGAGQARPRP